RRWEKRVDKDKHYKVFNDQTDREIRVMKMTPRGPLNGQPLLTKGTSQRTGNKSEATLACLGGSPFWHRHTTVIPGHTHVRTQRLDKNSLSAVIHEADKPNLGVVQIKVVVVGVIRVSSYGRTKAGKCGPGLAVISK
ncbi:hypothetical protein BaRGS_00007749, partial [Batillaria attramentaria]